MKRSDVFRRVGIVLLVVLLTAPPMVEARDGETDENPGPMGKPSDTRTIGWVLVPTPESARTFTPMQAQGITVSYLQVTPGAQFTLETTDRTSSRTCILVACVETGDFDIVFFREQSDGSTRVTARHTDIGAESGEVPPHSDFAFVYLKTPGTNPTARGFEYVYTETLSGPGNSGR